MKYSLLLLLIACKRETRHNVETGTTDSPTEPSNNSQILIETNMGAFTIELDKENAPITTDNFLQYVETGFYDGQDGQGATIFHRVIADFMIQGGGETVDGVLKETLPPISNEANNGLSNLRGTVAMARTNDPNSATAQFFVNVVDNTYLDFSDSGAGYAVFATVVDGMDVVDAISITNTDSADRPVSDIVIEYVGP